MSKLTVGDMAVQVEPALKLWAISSGAHYYKHSVQALLHHRRKQIAQGGDCVKKNGFVAEDCLH